jgi:uncharacterized protein (TIGR02996 family)
MTEQEALLAAIRDNPDDDTPRLIYADWLDEHATTDAERARAEFIRVQIELHSLMAQGTGEKNRRRYDELQKRANELLEQFQDEWLRGLPGAVQKEAYLSRGFVESLSFNTARYMGELLPRWDQELPVAVYLAGSARLLESAVRRGLLDNIRMASLSVSTDRSAVADGLASAIASSPSVANLRVLTFESQVLRDVGITAVAASAVLRELRGLSIAGDLTTATLATLADSPIVERLETLSLTGIGYFGASGSRPGPEGAAALAASTRLSGLSHLQLSSNEIGWSGLQAILTSRHLNTLRQLQIDDDALGGTPSAALELNLPNLEQLRLCRCELSDDDLLAFIASLLVQRISDLDLSDNRVTAAGIQALADGGPYSRLESLDLSANLLGNEGLKILSRSEAFPALRRLSLINVNIDDTGASRMLSACWADQLKELWLGSSDFITPWMRDKLRERYGEVAR